MSLTLRTLMVMALLVTTVNAADDTMSLTAIGTPNCGDWIRHHSEPDKAWLLGYLSGLNAMGITVKRTVDRIPKLKSAEQAYLWMDNYCRANPLGNLFMGGAVLFGELDRQ